MSALAGWVRKVLDMPPPDAESERVTRGESVVSEVRPGDDLIFEPYIEPEPSTWGWLRDTMPSLSDVNHYLLALIPFVEWLPRYNRMWFVGDIVAGITVGVVVVPQGMAYAKLANLAPEYGLYSSFVGVMLYWFFATSKDITIGPVAVMSTLTGQIIQEVQATYPQYSGPDIASAIAILGGAVITALGVFRLGFIVDFIPVPSIAAFMTGSAINIISGQVKTLLGENSVQTRDGTYLAIINTLKALPTAGIDAAMGVSALVLLYLIRFGFSYLSKRYPDRARTFFFVSTLRTSFVILLFTLISWLVNMDRRDNPRFSILGNVPRGLQHMGVPSVTLDMAKIIGPELPGAVIVMLIEHIAISKSFGRVNNYAIQPSQELIAIGITNLFAPFFGAYPATGSFSRTAIKSKAGVRTPLAGLITGVVVILAIYALPPVFFYIPNPSLAGVIIHAVGDLITSPRTLYRFWRASPPEVVVFWAGIIGSVFGTIEIGIYVTVALTGGLMLFRFAKANGEFLGRVRVRSVDGKQMRDIWVPLNHADGLNPAIPVEQPAPGVFVFRLSYPYLYANAFHYTEQLVNYVFAHTRRPKSQAIQSAGERPWNDPGPRKKNKRGKGNRGWFRFGKKVKDEGENDTSEDVVEEGGYDYTKEQESLPILKAVILDFASVAHVDVTSAQNLYDVRRQLERYTAPEVVEWHFANVQSPWVKRALASVGFGEPFGSKMEPIFTVAEIGKIGDYPGAEATQRRKGSGRRKSSTGESAVTRDDIENAVNTLPVLSSDRQAFHVDLPSAVDFVVRRLGDEDDEDEKSEEKKENVDKFPTSKKPSSPPDSQSTPR